jgi:shikimate dehydrogenase
MDGSAQVIGSVNTIVTTDGQLRAYDTDYLAIAKLLADRYGFTWRAEVGSSRPQLLVNATPVGMSGGPAAADLPVAPEVVDAAETIMDVVALAALTPLVRRARAQGKRVITGTEVIALQAVEQFVLYTGVRPTDD